jgi:hypothetical protein
MQVSQISWVGELVIVQQMLIIQILFGDNAGEANKCYQSNFIGVSAGRCNKCNNSNFFGGYGQGATDANFQISW